MRGAAVGRVGGPPGPTHVYFTGLKIHIIDRYADYSAFIFIWYGYAAGAGPSRPRIELAARERCSVACFVLRFVRCKRYNYEFECAAPCEVRSMHF